MSDWRRTGGRALLLPGMLIAALAAAGFVFFAGDGGGTAAEAPAHDRHRLMLVTTLPLIFPDEFAIEGGGSEALEALEKRFEVVPIGTTDPQSLRQGRLLLMAHALAQPAEALVELDRWVRAGGRVLILADPKLAWPSERPLGDKLRPPLAFPDTGLLDHWGVQLDESPEQGRVERELGGHTVLTLSPGEISGTCRISDDRFVARCPLGKGQATIVADADFLNVENLGGDARRNLEGLLNELESLRR